MTRALALLSWLGILAASQAAPGQTIVGKIDRIVERPPHGSRAEGYADIGGRRTLVSLPFDARTGRAHGRIGRIGVDVNGDGTIDFSAVTTSEVMWTDGKPPLFRVAGQVVSVESVDSAARTFLLRVHPPEAYKYIELRAGDEMPAFAFTDFEGRARKL